MVIAGAGAGLLLGVEWLRGVVALQELKELDARYAPFAEIGQSQDELEARIAALRAREQLTLRLSRDQASVALLGALSLAASEVAGSVYLESIDYDVAETAGSNRSVRLRGAGADSGAVAAFAERLRESGVFDAVAVESTGALPGGAASLRRFGIACQL